MTELHSLTPTVGQNFHDFFKAAFALAYRVTEFSVLPCLCTRIALAIQYDHALVFPTKFIETIQSIYDFEQFVYDSVPPIVVYHGTPSSALSTSGNASLFALNTKTRISVGDSYFCPNCTYHKCSGSHQN